MGYTKQNKTMIKIRVVVVVFFVVYVGLMGWFRYGESHISWCWCCWFWTCRWFRAYVRL